ncbi:MutS-related protein [Formosa sp. A9]|uniref:MutS-related protein n=1 Tax=Formosa sp. A9 TaxID=3442641 RepID=UPI003EBB61C5
MNRPISFYQNQSQSHQKVVATLNTQIRTLSMARLQVFLASAYGVYATFKEWQIALIIGGVGLAVFLFLLVKYSNIKYKRNIEKALVAINNEEINIIKNGFLHRPDGVEFQDPKHAYSLDIDVFGRGSLFQSINRTYIAGGTQKLAEILKANTVEGIKKRQDAITELADKATWRQYYSALSSVVQVEVPAKTINSWLKGYTPKLPSYFNIIPWLFGGVSLVLLVCVYFSVLSANILGLWLLVGLLFTGVYLKTINVLSSQTEKLKNTFKQYAGLLEQIEQEKFTSSLLIEQQKQIAHDTEKASQIFKELSGLLDRLDNRNNLISAIFGNGLFLLDIKHAYAIEQWIKKHGSKTTDWLEVIAFFDAYNALANYSFNHPQFTYPKLTKEVAVIEASQLGHPLLHSEKRIDNDFKIDRSQFFIITGANMAGKSTFLRTVSLYIVMANVGLPVCAQSSAYNPIKLITSMRTSDSLTDDSSYFFSELTRLKYIVDTVQTDAYFIVLDEILKGTNSTDKAIGSKQFVEKLVGLQATGIIATHDLSLCEIATELTQIRNHYFDAEIINNELHFDYTFKTGVCQNMNASFLLKKMEII